MRQMKQIPTKPCICVKTGKPIDCQNCAQPILDKDIDQKGCNHIPLCIEETFGQKKAKVQKQKRSIRQVLKCDCGNVINMYNTKKQVKCYKCDHFWDKTKEGKWEKQQFRITRDTLTIGDIPIKIKGKK